jgi:hypothetical protein
LKDIIEIFLTVISLIFGFSLTTLSMYFSKDNFNKILNYYKDENEKSNLDKFLDENKNFLLILLVFIFMNITVLYINYIKVFSCKCENIFLSIDFIYLLYILYRTFVFIDNLLINYKNIYSEMAEDILKKIKSEENNQNK